MKQSEQAAWRRWQFRLILTETGSVVLGKEHGFRGGGWSSSWALPRACRGIHSSQASVNPSVKWKWQCLSRAWMKQAVQDQVFSGGPRDEASLQCDGGAGRGETMTTVRAWSQPLS